MVACFPADVSAHTSVVSCAVREAGQQVRGVPTMLTTLMSGVCAIWEEVLEVQLPESALSGLCYSAQISHLPPGAAKTSLQGRRCSGGPFSAVAGLKLHSQLLVKTVLQQRRSHERIGASGRLQEILLAPVAMVVPVLAALLVLGRHPQWLGGVVLLGEV